jgi:serum/glucocorticoid-regulated kinase 2
MTPDSSDRNSISTSVTLSGAAQHGRGGSGGGGGGGGGGSGGGGKRGGVEVDDFTLLKMVGRGGFGKVYLARKVDDGQVFAMKILKKSHILQRRQVAHTVTERDVLARLNHPFIVNLHFAFQTSSKLHLVLDYCSGGELFYHLRKAGRFQEVNVAFYAAEAALALQYLHCHGVIYRDLKPENVLLDEAGHIKLADFGLAKEGMFEGKYTSSFCGSADYLAPEVISSEPYNNAVDWWSLGCLVYELIVGFPPFSDRGANRLRLYRRICDGRYVTKEGRGGGGGRGGG